LFWTGAYSEQEEQQAQQLINEPALFTAFQYKKLMETTGYEIAKMQPDIYEIAYEDFIKNPAESIKEIMTFLQLPESVLINKYLEKNCY